LSALDTSRGGRARRPATALDTSRGDLSAPGETPAAGEGQRGAQLYERIFLRHGDDPIRTESNFFPQTAIPAGIPARLDRMPGQTGGGERRSGGDRFWLNT
jgi:hypothetical protein